MVITDNPQTKQEQISQAMDVLARYLCLHRQTVLDNFPQKKYYTPRIAIKDQSVEMNQGACYRNNTLLRQEGIRYYTLPGVGTLQTAPLSLLRDLGYVTNNLEQYIVSEDITLTSSDSFFLESFSNKEIIPILDLTHTEGAKVWKRKFDTVKIVAYLESSQYPFVDGAVMLAVFALKGDNVIKITIPYGEIQHDLLANVMAIVKEMFVASIDMEVRDEVLTAKYFDAVYADALAHLSLTDTKLLKNIVHYYLSALWQYDESPEEFAKMIPSLIDKDLMLHIKLQSVLADLEAFL